MVFPTFKQDTILTRTNLLLLDVCLVFTILSDTCNSHLYINCFSNMFFFIEDYVGLSLNTEKVCKSLSDLFRQFGLQVGSTTVKQYMKRSSY